MSAAGQDLVREGRVWLFGDGIRIDSISPFRYMFDPRGRARNCLAAEDPEFGPNVAPGDILVAGRMFGRGLSHDHANVALRETGIGGIVARSLATQFLRNSVNYGLLVAECDQIGELAEPGMPLRVDFSTGEIEDPRSGRTLRGRVPSGPAAEIVAAGGLIPYLANEL